MCSTWKVHCHVLSSAMLSSVSVILALLFANRIWGQDYCSICREKNTHTLCLYQGYGTNCGANPEGQVSQQQKEEILNIHNHLRNKVASGNELRGTDGPQPPASNMKRMTWNEECATIAQRWADQCTFNHDKCRNLANNSAVGQNVYIIYTTATDIPVNYTDATMAWYDEVAEFNKSYIAPFQFSAATGHYTQLLWASTAQVGCGHTKFRNNGVVHVLIVCNYYPAGNILRGTMYVKGQSTCGCYSDYPALCGC